MRKAFLRAPLSYTRISSGFTYSRRHPITRKVRPHTGIDYAAPAGTEVMSIGDGVVVYKGYRTAEGNMVKIKHNSVYTSAYLHLYRVFHRSSSGFPYLEERHAYQPAEDGVSPGRASVKGRHACVPQEHGRVRDRRRPFRCAYGAETDGGNY